MKFLYSDTQDYVDPGYDFLADRNAPGRKRYWDDRYAHEIMEPAPYDGLLISISGVRSIKGAKTGHAHYSLAEEQRFLRDGARKFLRYSGPKFNDAMLMGDCGAFAYAELEKPAFSPEEVVEFYVDGGFTHGCAPDHIIFEFDPKNPSQNQMGEAIRKRYEITLENSKEFLRLVKSEGDPFEPIGPVQGWSPESMADAAETLESMGYRYLAIGGLVPLKTDAIHEALTAIKKRVRLETRLHLLGFAKADRIDEFVKYDVESFDSTSPLLRAFKDSKANYYLPGSNGKLEYYAAVRIPQAIENTRLVNAIKQGRLNAEEIQTHEVRALAALRGYDKGKVSKQTALEILSSYQDLLVEGSGSTSDLKKAESSLTQLDRTLTAKPWTQCSCSICREIGVEVIIFRSSNRNKRRGFHNLAVYHSHLKNTLSDRA